MWIKMLATSNLHWLKRFLTNLSDRRAFLFSLALGFVIRLIPEVLSFPNPIGFDTVYYAARIKSGVVWSGWTGIFSMWLFDGILISVDKIVQMNPFLLLKLSAPLLYALNVCGIYHFSRKALNSSVKTALLAAFFFAFQLASLRLSWDLQRNLLGSAVLLFTLPMVGRVSFSKRNIAVLLMLSSLLVLSHMLTSAVLFAVVLTTFIDGWLKGERLRALKLSAVVLPAFALLLTSILVFPTTFYIPENVTVSDDVIHHSPVGLFFMVDYLGVSDAVQNYPSYPYLVLHVLSLFSVLYLWWLPLVVVGFFRNRILDRWTLVLLFGSFNALITPFFALDLWNRWMFMLVYPFTFYAVKGIEKVSTLGSKSVASDINWLGWMKVSRRAMLGIISLTIVLGSIFLAVPPFFDRYGVFAIPTVSSYLPSTMLYNTVPLRDVNSTIKVMEWLNEHMSNRSSLLVHHAFLWWGVFYLDKRHSMIYFVKDTKKALNIALNRGSDPIYLLWWNEDYFTWQNQTIGWYGLTVPKHFIYTFSNDRISVYRYSPN